MKDLRDNLNKLAQESPELEEHVKVIVSHLDGFDFFDMPDEEYVDNTHPDLSRFMNLKRGDRFKVGRKTFRVTKDEGTVKIVVVDRSAETKMFEALPSSPDETSSEVEVWEIDGMRKRVDRKPYAQGPVKF